MNLKPKVTYTSNNNISKGQTKNFTYKRNHCKNSYNHNSILSYFLALKSNTNFHKFMLEESYVKLFKVYEFIRIDFSYQL